MTVQKLACDSCGRVANGDSVDYILNLSCPHEICNNCLNKSRRKHPTTKHPKEWCPVCNKEVSNAYDPHFKKETR